MKPRTLCCHALPMKVGLKKRYKYECATCGLIKKQVGNKKLYLKVQRKIKAFMENAPKDYDKMQEYVQDLSSITTNS